MRGGKIRKFLIKILPYGLEKKLFFLILIVGTFLMVSLISVVTGISSKFLYDSTKSQLQNQTRQVVNVFDQHMDSLKNIVLTADSQTSFKQLINGNQSGYRSYVVSRDSYNYVKTIHQFYKWVNLYAFALNDNYVMGSKTGNISSEFSIEDSENTYWYNEVSKSLSNINIRSDFRPPITGGKEEFAYIFTVRELYTWKVKGFIAATLDKSVLDDLLENTLFQENGFMVIMDKEGNVAYTSNEALYQNQKDIVQGIKNFDNQREVLSNDGMDEYYMISVKSSINDWRFVSFADTDYLKNKVFELQVAVIILFITGLILLLMAARFASGLVVKPINKLIAFIHKVEETEFSQQLNVKANDEIGELLASFNMLVSSVRENQVLRKKAEIDALQKQIDPHFLFNTLESIKALAIRNNTGAVCDTIDRLGDMFRYNTNRDNTFTTCISYEIGHISDYLHIQKMRFGERLHFQLEIEPDILQNTTLKFILQPIVENSIRYGMEKMDSNYMLVIKGYEKDGDFVVFEIIDNGPGIPPEKLDKIKLYIYDTSGRVPNDGIGIGLKNIHERISLFYSEKCGIDIESVSHEYTMVTVTIPKSTKLNGDEEYVYVAGGR